MRRRHRRRGEDVHPLRAAAQRRNDGAPDPAEALVRGNPEWTWKTIDAGHDVMVTAPPELTEMLLAIG